MSNHTGDGRLDASRQFNGHDKITGSVEKGYQRGCNRLLMKCGLVCLYTSTETFLQMVRRLSRGAACRRTPCLRQQSLYSLLLGDKSSISGVVKTGSITGGLGESSRVMINHSHGDVFREGSAEGEGVKSAAKHASSRRWQTKASCEGTLKESSKLAPRSQRNGKSLPSTGRSPPHLRVYSGLGFVLFFKLDWVDSQTVNILPVDPSEPNIPDRDGVNRDASIFQHMQ